LSHFGFDFDSDFVCGMLVAVEEGLSLAGVLLLVAQKALLQDFRSPWLVLELQAQLAPQEVVAMVC
jgi:hypothetical protein